MIQLKRCGGSSVPSKSSWILHGDLRAKVRHIIKINYMVLNQTIFRQIISGLYFFYGNLHKDANQWRIWLMFFYIKLRRVGLLLDEYGPFFCFCLFLFKRAIMRLIYIGNFAQRVLLVVRGKVARKYLKVAIWFWCRMLSKSISGHFSEIGVLPAHMCSITLGSDEHNRSRSRQPNRFFVSHLRPAVN